MKLPEIVAEPAEASTVDVTIEAASIDTGNADRDAHLRSPDFLDVERFPALTYRGSRATRLSYLLWNTTPDHELLEAAQKGELNTQEGLDKQVGLMMASPRLEVGMRAFFNDMLELDTFDTVSKDSILYPKWGSAIANSAKEETLRTMIGLSLKENGDIRDLMTTKKTYINRNLAAIYQLPFSFTSDRLPFRLPS